MVARPELRTIFGLRDRVNKSADYTVIFDISADLVLTPHLMSGHNLSAANAGVVAGARIAIDVPCVFGPPLNFMTVRPTSRPDVTDRPIQFVNNPARQPSINHTDAQPPDAFSASTATALHQSKEVTKLSEYNL